MGGIAVVTLGGALTYEPRERMGVRFKCTRFAAKGKGSTLLLRLAGFPTESYLRGPIDFNGSVQPPTRRSCRLPQRNTYFAGICVYAPDKSPSGNAESRLITTLAIVAPSPSAAAGGSVEGDASLEKAPARQPPLKS